MRSAPPLPLLRVENLNAHYGDFQALFGVSLTVGAGEVAAVIGANGAGKSTLLNSIAGLIRSRADAIVFGGEPIGTLSAFRVLARGIALVPEGRRLFPSLTVEENLVIGGQIRRPGAWNLRRVYQVFPVLEERRNQASMSLSGGQQQMVAIARGLAANPKILAVDEPCLGLAEAIAKRVYDVLGQIHADGTTLIVVEEAPRRALTLCNRRVEVRNGMAGAA